MILVDDNLIQHILDAEVEISLMPLALGFLLITLGGIVYLKWGVKYNE
jgi:hypothetical protein